jgi:hypothetical protein
VVWFSPREKHWHAATPTTAMTHIAIQEKKDGKRPRQKRIQGEVALPASGPHQEVVLKGHGFSRATQILR